MSTDPKAATSSTQALRIEDRPDEGRYVAELEGRSAYLEYQLNGKTMVITYTEVPPEFRGKGIGGRLVRGVLDDVRRRGLRVIPVCGYVRSVIREHSEYQDLLSADDPYAST